MSYKKIARSFAVAAAALAGFTTSAHAFNIEGNVEGFWYEEGLGGNRGWSFQYLPNGPEQGVLFVAGYVYDAEGNANWLVGQSTVYDGEYEVDLPLLAFTGGSFGPGAGGPSSSAAGNLNVVFNSCTSADFTFTGVPDVDDFTAEFQPFLNIVGGPDPSNCVYQKEFEGCPSFAENLGDRSCGLSGTITQDITLTNDTTWVLTQATFIGAVQGEGDPVPDGPTLTIEPGTRIVGLPAQRVALVISRGSRIIADGLPHAPIVMTGPNYAGTGASPQDWGGLVINGAAELNVCDTGVCEAEGEGETGWFGGDNPHDNSGVLRYVRVQFAGDSVTDEDQLNGIAFQGVGDGTVVDYVQVHAGYDDGIEFFGGTVNAKHLVITNILDDSVDWTFGYRGKLQHVLVKQNPDVETDADKLMELDNWSTNRDAEPRAQPVMANFTLIGRPGTGGIVTRAGTGGNFSNFVVADAAWCLDIDDDATFAAAGTPGSPTGVLTLQNSVFDCGTAFEEEEGDPWSISDFVLQQDNNAVGDSMLDGIFPAADADYLSGFPLDNSYYDGGFFDMTDYVGAFKSRESAWVWGWTEFLDD